MRDQPNGKGARHSARGAVVRFPRSALPHIDEVGELATEQLRRTDGYPVFGSALPDGDIVDRGCRVRFARTPEELEAVQRLRFEVFNLELGEGLDESFERGLDADRFDPVCHHLLVIDEPSQKIVGTYRMQTSEMAAHYGGFYSVEEFTVDDLGRTVLEDAIEIGRACVARDFRSRQMLFMLWKGLAQYLAHNRKRFLFGCCSLTSQDSLEGWRVMEHLRDKDCVHTAHRVNPQPGWECFAPGFAPDPGSLQPKVNLPKLFNLYLRFGAKVCGDPALDRFFKTIDYLVLFDLQDLGDHSRRIFFGG
jgi:putative hemolysin